MPVDTISRDLTGSDNVGRLYRVPDLTPKYYGSRRQNNGGAKQPTPRLDLIKKRRTIALDVEGVILPDEFSIGECGAGRTSATNSSGQIVMDMFMHYPPEVNQRRPPA